MAELSLGQQVKYTDDESNQILATIQAKNSDGKLVISVAGGETKTVDTTDVNEELKLS